MSLPSIHRVVTGHDANGKGVIVSDGPLPTVVEMAALPGMIFHEIWETHGMPAPVDNCPDPTLGDTMHGPPKNGTRIRFVDFPPDASYVGKPDVAPNMKALFDQVNNPEGLRTKADSPHPMMHCTEAIDYGIVTDGEMTLILDDSEVELRPGSVVIQRGTNHAWANRSDKPSRMLFIQIDGKYAPSITEALGRR